MPPTVDKFGAFPRIFAEPGTDDGRKTRNCPSAQPGHVTALAVYVYVPLTTDLMLSLRGEIDGRALESANLNLLADRCPIEGQSEYQKVFR